MDTRHRLSLAAALGLLPVIPLAARLTQLQVMQHSRLDSRASGQFKRSSVDVVPRGDIVDRNGDVLARSVPTWSCFVDKAMIKSPGQVAPRLAAALQASPEEVARKIRKEGRFSWIRTDLSFEEMSRLASARIDSVGIVAGQQRVHPNGALAENLIGMVGRESRGVSGLELSFDRQLTGKARKFEVIRDGSGHMIYQSAAASARQPPALALTIDKSFQYYCEEALAEAAARFSIKNGFAAVQDPNNGEILAMASYPPGALKNSLVQDSYEPGSTFKVVAAAAAIAEARVSENDVFFCENGTYELAPKVVIHDHEPKGSLTLSGILEHSSNIGIAKVVERVGPRDFLRYGRAFGFANKTGIQLPGETAGALKEISEMTKVGLAASSYGYGVGVSALQILGAYSAIANGGTLWEPSIINDGRKPARVRRVADAKTMASLSAMLQAVVDRGTGIQAQIPGYSVAGKTGTARKLDPSTKEYSMSQYNASFIGFVPAAKPQLTILVVIDEPKGQYYGGQVAAPIFAKIAARLLALKGVPPDRPAPSRLARAP